MNNDVLKNEFLVESFENLSSISEDLTAIEKNPNDKELLNKIYRTVHTMKGSASFLGYKKLQELTHSSENLLDAIREGLKVINAEIIDTLFQSFDICNSILKSIESDNHEGDASIAEIRDRLDSHLVEEESLEADSVEEEVALAFDDEDADLANMIKEHNQVSSSINPKASGLVEDSATETNLNESIEGISSAALESMKELIGSGKLDPSVLSEVSSDTTKVAKVENVATANSSSESESLVSSAALDSLKDLITDGSIDPKVLNEVQKEGPPVEKIQVDTQVEKKELKDPTKKEVAVAPAVNGSTLIGNSNNSNEDISKKSIADSVVRVNVNILDKIMNTVGELVLNRNQILQFSNSSNSSELSRLAMQLNTITSELQSDVMSTRMQPIGSILTKFERLVRDFARTSDKKINLKLSGQDTELDKTLIEAIKDPLVHIVRNACDHGLESAKDREQKGKVSTGTLLIRAYNESGQVTIEISDDGKGLSKDKILNKAIEKGLVSSDSAQMLSDQQIFSLIFSPGFSTAEKVTNISGRGVGMDVVKTNIEKIGGSVSLNSIEGEGTTFKLKIPLTLAIVPALIIKSNNESFAIPQLNLVELVRLETEEEKSLIEKVQGSEFLKLRGRLTPVFRLNDVLNLEEVNRRSILLQKAVDNIQINTGVTQSNQIKEDDVLKAENIIILSAEGFDFGIIVDEILDTEEIVVKPLNNNFKNLALFGGATIMGDGKVALILDALGFLNKFSTNREKNIDDKQELNDLESAKLHAGEEQENILFRLNDDRIYAVPLSLVTRLEEFNVSEIELTGKQPIVRYLDRAMPLINVEKTLKLEAKSVLEDSSLEKVSCIVTTIRNKNFGIIVKEIRDISIDNVNIDATAVDRDGILGTIFINDKTVSLLDLYKIIEVQNIGVRAPKTNLELKEIKANQNKKILLVDDSAMYRKMESDALIELGYDVTLAKHGEDGFKVFEAGDFDLIITDIEMPVMNGYDFASKVRAEAKNSSVPIVALSTRASASDKEKGKESGFTYHLEKFKKDEVIDLVASIFNGEI